jgi:hypothetical protein
MRLTRREFAHTLAAMLASVAVGPEGPTAWARSTGVTTRWTFDVLLQGRRIGRHRIALERQGSELVARTEIDLRVRLLFVTLAKLRLKPTSESRTSERSG